MRRIIDDFGSIEDIPKEPWVEYQRKVNGRTYLLKPGMKATVDPISKAKSQEKFRNKKCVVLWIGGIHIFKAGIMYLDTSEYDEREFKDLIPLPADIINLAEKRSEKKSSTK